MAQKVTKPATPVRAATPITKSSTKIEAHFVFDKSNYRFLIISIAVVALGFILMSGTTDIYSNTKIVLAPVTVLAGFAIGFYAILKKPAAKA
jgi:hypothetical protein